VLTQLWYLAEKFHSKRVPSSMFLQELTYIRPIRMMSPKAMPSDGNTCHVGWGSPESGSNKASDIEQTLQGSTKAQRSDTTV